MDRELNMSVHYGFVERFLLRGPKDVETDPMLNQRRPLAVHITAFAAL